jgi:pyruvate/2-oxoglutarate dehydrogenase complex dihydrolipoamide dehydrogenase (E3) component
MPAMSPELAPLDENNQTLLANAHPANWKNPRPSGRYHLVAIGGGTAGIIAALGAAGLGARAALIERRLLGGDCLNYGCVPSKALLRAARAAYQVSQAARFGVQANTSPPDFAQVMERLRRLRAQISHHDSAQRFASLGVDVYLGSARFTGPTSLEVDGTRLDFRRAVIATGARAAAPDIPGLEEAGYLTNETVFSLTELPQRLIVIGAGPVGCELAQAFRRLGSEVHLVNRSDRILPKEDPAAAALVKEQFEREGIHLHLGWSMKAETTGHSKSLLLQRGEEKKKLLADAILVGVGRRPNLEGLNLEAAGVNYTAHGVSVDDRLRTTNPRIYAAGDICSRHQFTHAADAMARVAIQNALFRGRKKASALVIPRCTYTDPEVAHVGLTPDEARQQGIELDSYRADLADVDRAVLDGEEQGFAVVHTRKGKGRIVGATIVAAHAGEMIGEVSLLMTRRLGLGALAHVIHCYPTQVEVLKRIADQYQRTRLTPRVAKLLRFWLRWGV